MKRTTIVPPFGANPPPHTHAIRRVLDERTVWMAYQPVVDLRTRKVFAYEALVRSKAPEFATPPDLFNAAVEHACTGELGRMLREMSLVGCPNFPLFLNIHPAELNERYIVQPDDPIFQHDRDVYLEITEGVPLSHFHLCQTILSEVRDRGVYLVVDDLGAGYSNLKYIADLQPRAVKLDRGLIAGLNTTSRLFKLVSAIVVLCHELGAVVVAEGIETVEELEAVIESGAQYGQGYLLARPAFPLPEVKWPEELLDGSRRRGTKHTLKPRTTTRTRRR
ncbi:MAG: EAL domain-containing protein [Deltaproteobacteria bacterium]|nr:EAL domain-containing protein [Deltaproteobacteria bacterium]